MTVRLKDAADPTSEIAKGLKNLGVTVRDEKGNLRSNNDILLDMFNALSKLPEGFERNQALALLFGRNIGNIADLASLSRDELKKLMGQAPVFSEEKINNLDDANTKLALMNEKVRDLNIELGQKLVPIITDSVIPAFEGMTPFLKDAITLLDRVGEAADRAGTGYAMLRDPGNWEKIAAGFNTRQAQREWSRNFQELQDWAAQNPLYERDPFGLSKNPLLAKKPFSLYTPPGSSGGTGGGPGTGSSGGGAGGTGGADTYANNQLAMQKKYSGPAVYEGVKGNWDKGVFYPDVGPPTSAKAPANWLEKIGAKYDRGEISRYALGVSKGEQNLAAEALQRQTNLSKLPLRDQPQREPQKVEVALKLEFNTPEAARLFKVILDRDSTRNRRALGYPDIT